MGLILVREGKDMTRSWSLHDGKLSEKRGMLGTKCSDICLRNGAGAVVAWCQMPRYMVNDSYFSKGFIIPKLTARMSKIIGLIL